MAEEKLQLNQIVTGWQVAIGGVANIDEAIADADGLIHGPGIEDDVGLFAFSDTTGAITDSAAVSSVDIEIRVRDTGTAGTKTLDVTMFQGASNRGTTTINTNSSLTNHTVTNAGWDSDWTKAELDDMRVELIPHQAGMPGTNRVDLDCAEAIITFTAPFTVEFNAFRFYDDSGGEAASNALAAQDINISVDVTAGDVDLQLRIRCDETGGVNGADTDDWQAQYDPSSTGFVNLTISDSDGVIATAAGLTDGNDTTNRASEPISDPAGSFDAGEQSDSGSVIDRQLLGNQFTEHVYGMRFVSASLTDGDTFDFQLSTPTGIVNNIVPRVTIQKSAGGGRIMSSLAGHGGLAGSGGIAGSGGGLAGS